MKLIFTNASSSAIRSLRPVRPTRSGLAVSVPGLLAIGLLLQGVAAGQKPTVAVYPASIYLTDSQSLQFIAAVTRATSPGVTWSISPAVGTISQTGRYTAPATVSGAQTVTVTASTSYLANSGDVTTMILASGSATVSLIAQVNLSVSPSTASLSVSGSQQFTAVVSNTKKTGVNWSVSPAVGTVSSTGLYTAPASISSAQTVTIKATSAADPTKSASASVALAPPTTVSLTPTTVSLTPTTVSLTGSQAQQFTATVSGSSNTGVTWSVNPSVGTVSSTGLYTAPASISSAQNVTVKATSAADPTKSASANIGLAPPVTVSLTPTTVSLTGSQAQQFTATVNGSSNTGVTWSVNPSVGTVSSTGLYTAPTSIASAQNVTLTATSAADPTKSASASIALTPPVAVSVTPFTASLTASQTQQFTATVSGSSNTAVTWSLSPAAGTISGTGLYTAPASISSAQNVTVKATSAADPTKSASANIGLAPPVTVSLTPTTVSLTGSQAQQFTAAVSGTTNTGVTWSLSPAVGTISSSGLYTTPASISSPQTVTVKATSAADTTKSASASIALAPPATVSLTPLTASLSASQTQQFSATVSGSSNTGITWSVNPAVGTVSSTGLYTAPASIASAQNVTVKATSAADATKSASASIALAPPATVSLTPLTASLSASQTQQFVATVSGSSNTGVTWSVNPAVGTVSSTGLYTAPASIASAQNVTVKATSNADSTKSASANIGLAPPTTVSLTPTTVSLTGSQAQQFTATVNGSSNTAVTWSVNPSVGTVSSTGLYTAPTSISSAQNITVKATSAADSSKSASASIALAPTATVSLTPLTASLSASQTQQFSATVSGSSNTGITWSVNPAVGTVSSTGLYTAPASIASAQNVTVKATSAADPTKSASASIALAPPATVSLTPLTASLSASQTQQFTATVNGSSNTGVNWSVNPAVGTVSSTGLYTAPALIASAQIVTVKATSAADPTKSASASITLAPTVTVSVTPNAASLLPSTNQQLTATVSGTTNTGVTWSLNPSVGGLSTAGGRAVYTAPSIVTVAQSVRVAATSLEDPTKTASAVLALIQVITVSVNPASVTVGAAATQQFVATVAGSTDTSVRWSVNPALGTIDSTGLYTAPATVLTSQLVTVTAKSNADQSKSSTAQVTVAPAGVQYRIGPNGPTSLTYNGTEYNWPVGFISYEYWTPPTGPEGGHVASTIAGKSAAGSTLSQSYVTDAQHKWQLDATYSGAGTNTLQIDFTITNQATTDILRPQFTPLAWNLPGPTTGQCAWDLWWPLNGVSYPAGFLTQGTTSMAWWVEPANAYIQSQTTCSGPTQTKFTIQFLTKNTNGPVLYTETLKPGEQKHWRLNFRFGDSTKTAMTLAPEAASSYAAAFPFIVPLKDRRPIGRVMITNPNTNRSNCTAQNPRCYNFSFFPDALGDPAGFRNAALAFANRTVSILNGLTNRPQGVIIWDLEGQEFLQTFSYVGDPEHLPQLAPEMDAIADEFIGTFKNAGYKVGLTLRPQKFLLGSTLPATCSYNLNATLRDVFVNTAGTPMYRGYICNAPNTWVQEGQGKPGVQTDPVSYQDLFDTLSRKIQYAQNRWGATLFYVDSDGWSSDGQLLTPQIWRDLVAKFPNVTFFPEHRQYGSYGAASAYNGDQPLQIWETETIPELLWPSLPFTLTVIDESGSFGAHQATAIDGVRKGDMLLFDSWAAFPGVAGTDAIYSAALVMNSQTLVTDQTTAKTYSFSSSLANPSDPAPACNPTKFRVVFAPTADAIGVSKTFCWSTGNCTLDLRGMAFSQIQRANFNNDICSSDPVVPIP